MNRKAMLTIKLKARKANLERMKLRLESEINENEIQFLCDQIGDLECEIGDLTSAIKEIDYLNGEEN